MKALDCARAALVEAHRDGRLGAHESAAMDRHVQACATCASLARDLDRIAETLRAPREPARPLEHQREKLALLRRATDGAAKPRPARAASPAVRLAMAAVALAAAVALGWIGAGFGRAPRTPEVAQHLQPPPHLAARETTIRPSDDAHFDRTRSAGLEVITLDSGTLDVTVRPLAPGERFVVRTGDAEVEVRGNALRVHADAGKIRSVTAVEGAVEVRYAGVVAIIPTGGSWQATGDARDTSDTSAPAPPPAPPPAIDASASASASASAPPPPAPRVPRVPSRARRIDPPHAAEHAPAIEGSAAPPVETAAPPAPPPPAMSPASRAFADAMSAVRRGDFAAGAAQLDAFSKAHGTDARADEADYLRAVALQRAGRKADAVAAAKHYLATRPSGAHRAEAQRLAGE